MAMSTLQLYRNPYVYPDYGKITTYGNNKNCTPVGMGLKTGTIRVEGTQNDFLSCNYLGITRDNKTIYGWIDDVQYLNDRLYNVSYKVDPWRTYKNNISLGDQYVARDQNATNKRDSLLSGNRQEPDIERHSFFNYQNGPKIRYLIVQVKRNGDDAVHTTPVQPSPYQFYAKSYNIDDWTKTQPIFDLIFNLALGGESNVITMYSVPHIDNDHLSKVPLPFYDGSVYTNIDGWYAFDKETPHKAVSETFDIPTIKNKDSLMRVSHSVQLVIPEAGIVSIPDEIIRLGELKLRRDIDIYSGSSNYMVEADGKLFDLSVRGSGVSTIPVLSDIQETYVSQNQNALATSLIGDVASLGAGVGLSAMGGGAGMAMGINSLISGTTNIASTLGGVSDMGNKMGNPPAMLGSALSAQFNNTFWLIITKEHTTNESKVHSRYGYPQGYVKKLSVPSKGFIKTENCSVTSNGNVPLWAINEINSMFDIGLRVH